MKGCGILPSMNSLNSTSHWMVGSRNVSSLSKIHHHDKGASTRWANRKNDRFKACDCEALAFLIGANIAPVIFLDAKEDYSDDGWCTGSS